MDVVKENIRLNELAQRENLSVRSSNVCESNGLTDLISILKYFWENKNFLRLRLCGYKSNEELIQLCIKYEYFISKPEKILTPDNPIEKIIELLTVRQKKIINNVIESTASNLSPRSFKALKIHTDSNLSIRGLKEILLNPRYDLRNIRNVGNKSIDELTHFFYDIRDQIEIIQLFDNAEELSIELFNSSLRKRFRMKSDDIVKIWQNYDCENGLPIFKTINVLISGNYLFSEKEKEIFKKSFNFWTNSEIDSLENIGSFLGITSERTRQIRKKIFNEIDKKLSLINTLEFDALNLYGIDENADILAIDENFIEEIQQKEDVCFNDIFVTKIISILLNKTHVVIGNIESCVFSSSKPKGINYRWKSIYLVKNEIVASFNFESLVIDVKRRISKKIDEDYSFHFETYLTSFLNPLFEFDSTRIVPIAEHIVFNEFDISIDLFDNILFKRNTVKQVYEYSYEALKALGVPSNVEIIYKKVKELYPHFNTDENSIRASMQRKTGFVPFGRTSVYGLKIWEEEKNIRGGTIRDITEEYLKTQHEPKHIDDIERYVNQYRNTTAKNIYSNLQMEAHSRFNFYKGLYIGLKAKQYNNIKFKKLDKRELTKRSWDESFELLLNFATENKRLPYSSGKKEEQKLYRFMAIQINKLSKGKLDKTKNEKLEGLISMYEYKKRRKKRPFKTDSSYDELFSFIQDNRRLPRANYDDEKRLYYFFYRQSKQYENDDLAFEQKIKYLKIKKIIQDVYGN